MTKRILTCVALALAPSCLNVTPEAPPPTRWLSIMPEAPRPGTNQGGVENQAPRTPNLRLGAVVASDAITDELIIRVSDVEVRYDPFVRWAESPAVVVERMLADELFQRHGFQLDAGATRRLDIEVIAFEEYRTPRRGGRVALQAILVDGDGKSLIHRRFSADIPVNGEDPALIAEALMTGVGRVVGEIAELMALK